MTPAAGRRDHPPGLGARDPLGQCARHAGHDRLGLADLQRLAAVSVRISPAITSAAGSAARCSGTSRPCGSWSSTASSIGLGIVDRPLPPQALADPRSRCGRATRAPRSRPALARRSAVYNAVQELLYLGVIAAGILIVLSGLALWKPVQFRAPRCSAATKPRAACISSPWRRSSLSSWSTSWSRLVPQSLRAMIRGRSAEEIVEECMPRLADHPASTPQLVIKDAASCRPIRRAACSSRRRQPRRAYRC